MTSQAKINANRRNAEKSTGPKTEEGRAVVSRNAVTHGLTSRYDVLSYEDRGEYEQYRQMILAELRPEGAMETLLAGRVVSLFWRLQRAGRLQGAVAEYLHAKEAYLEEPEDADPEDYCDELDPTETPQYRIARSVAGDFASERVMDRLSLYERRLENSYNKTIAEFHKWRKWKREEGTGARAGLKPAPTTDGKTKPNEGPCRDARCCVSFTPDGGDCFAPLLRK